MVVNVPPRAIPVHIRDADGCQAVSAAAAAYAPQTRIPMVMCQLALDGLARRFGHADLEAFLAVRTEIDAAARELGFDGIEAFVRERDLVVYGRRAA
jgi:hypothetical protein